MDYGLVGGFEGENKIHKEYRQTQNGHRNKEIVCSLFEVEVQIVIAFDEVASCRIAP